MKKVSKIVFFLIIVVFVILQFIRLDKNEDGYESISDFKTETNVSEKVYSILKTHCFDCHSNQTIYPWYAEIAPLSFWFKDHIDEGKEELNFSKWKNYSTKKKDHKLEELIEEVDEGEMPLDSYTWIHGKLPKDDQKVLLEWAAITRLKYQSELKVSAK